MKKFALIAIAALIAGSAFADPWMGDTYVNVNGQWFKGSGSDDWGGVAANSFDQYDLGTLTSLTLGGQMQVYPNGADPATWSGADAEWLWYKLDDAVDYTGLHLKASRVNGNNIVIQSGGVYGDPDAFTGDAINISGLTGQDHTLSVYFGPVDGMYDGGGSEKVIYTATFHTAAAPSEIPEPATMSLLGLGALALALRRKLRK